MIGGMQYGRSTMLDAVDTGANLGADRIDLEDDAMRAVVDASLDCIKVVELDGTLSFMNVNGLLSMEIDDRARFVGKPWVDLWPESTRSEVLDAIAAARSGGSARFEAYCPTAKGSPRWWDVLVSPVRGRDRTVERIVAVARDVTERVHRENRLRLQEMELNQLALEQADMLRDQKESLEANDTLLREVDHRMKNSLAMLGSLLKMETNRVSDETAKASLKAAAARVATIASVHEQLHRGTEKDALAVEPYLAALVRDLVNSMTAGPGGLIVDARVEADDIIMRGGKALALGLATVELVMNAIRHGRANGTCSVRVECRCVGDAMRLTVSDTGPGLPSDFDPARSRGLGMRVVQSSLAKLGGTLGHESRPGGGAIFFMDWPA